MKFPQPWQIERTGETDCVVLDADGRKLFYICGDEGSGPLEADEKKDEDYIEPSVLFYGSDADSEMLIDEIHELLIKGSQDVKNENLPDV